MFNLLAMTSSVSGSINPEALAIINEMKTAALVFMLIAGAMSLALAGLAIWMLVMSFKHSS